MQLHLAFFIHNKYFCPIVTHTFIKVLDIIHLVPLCNYKNEKCIYIEIMNEIELNSLHIFDECYIDDFMQ